MIIEKKIDIKTVPFRTLKGGDCFSRENNFEDSAVLMKIDDGEDVYGNKINCVDLQDGELLLADLCDEVVPWTVSVSCRIGR